MKSGIILYVVALAATAFAWPQGDGSDESWSPRAADPARADERCHAWAVAATGVDPVAESQRPYVPSPNAVPEEESERFLRFNRGYDACLASLGLMYR